MFILPHLRAVLVTAIFSITIIMISVPVVVFALVKLLIPVPALRRAIDRLLDAASNVWITFNTWQQEHTLPTQVEVDGLGNLSRAEWYMLIANHQSWPDILVLVRAFNARIPGVKFFFNPQIYLGIRYRYEWFFNRFERVGRDADHGNHVFNIGFGYLWGGARKP